ncbi:hypothetical protein C2E20_4426 [Micractinium conductrix]|uniref:Uncharacterized protein n=1 Tax=Micractinium conductrix TaxID=554055 RepID=A0A2P6VDF9_9CHLO|nr:hypothetical protein C2E20_4426 [Micractinium conductrix]|eukprot:PSC72128.1 hypothetical protein C2E20_4426 [Micractinium conductrix]
MARLTFLFVALLAVAGSAQAVTLAELLTREELKPFITEVIRIKECISDPKLAEFDFDECPSLQRMLDALNLGNSNPAVTCELSCIAQFDKLSEECTGALRDTFTDSQTSLGKLADKFFETCDELVSGGAAASPVLAPTPAEDEPLAPAVAPSPEPATPAPIPAPAAAAAAALPASLALSLLAAAAFTLLAEQQISTMRAAALLALALLACASVSAVEVGDTVTAVAIRKKYRTAIKKFVSTYACATDDLIFNADFTTCDFQFVEDVVDKKKTISPITCDYTCASQFKVVTPDCATQFRERMLGDTRFGDEAKEFFADCDKQVPPPKGAGCPSDGPCGTDEEADSVSKQDLVTGKAGSPAEAPVAEPPAVDAEPPTEEQPAPPGTGAPDVEDITASPPVEAPSPAPGPDDIVPPPIPAPPAGASAVTTSVALLLAAVLAALLSPRAAAVRHLVSSKAKAVLNFKRVKGGRSRREHWPAAGAPGPLTRPEHVEAKKAAAAADDAALAPCEQRPQEQQTNTIDEQLAAAVQQGQEAVLAVVAADGERFSELNVVSALRAVADAAAAQGGSPKTGKKKTKKGGNGHGGPPQELLRSPNFQALIDMLLAGLQRFQPTLLAQAVAACATTGACEEMLLDEVARHVMCDDVMAALSAADVADLACGMAALDHSPGVTLFEALAARAAQLRGDLSPQRQQEVRAAFEALGYADYAPF